MGGNEEITEMIESLTDFERFRRFLESIPLDKYREELKDVKWVEQDLYKELLPLESIFKYYWETREFLSFEDWFENFWREINTIPEKKEALEKFKRYYFNRELGENDWFRKGFKARMYRTWISLLTQLDFCYVFEYVVSRKGLNLQLVCNADLDAKGIDAMVNDIGFQIAKISERKEARAGKTKKKIVPIPYAVYNLEEMKRRMESPRTRKKEVYIRKLKAFDKYFSVLKNGFVVFKEEYIERVVDNINDFNVLKEMILRIQNELMR
jgi:hypothetical protein